MVPHALNLVVVAAAEWLVHVVGVRVLGAFALVTVGIALSQYSLTGKLVLLHHLNAENVVDFDVVGTEAVVLEVWWEHHIVALEPELGVVLLIEEVQVSGPHESESRKHQHRCKHPHENSSDVDWTLGHTNKSRESWSHHGHNLVAINPVPIDDLHDAKQGVLTVLTLAHLVEAG